MSFCEKPSALQCDKIVLTLTYELYKNGVTKEWLLPVVRPRDNKFSLSCQGVLDTCDFPFPSIALLYPTQPLNGFLGEVAFVDVTSPGHRSNSRSEESSLAYFRRHVFPVFVKPAFSPDEVVPLVSFDHAFPFFLKTICSPHG